MFSAKANNMINQIYKKVLRIVLNDHISDTETMFRNIVGIISHFRNIQTLTIKLFKIMYNLSLPTMDSMLNRRTICRNLRNLKIVSDGMKDNCVIWS